MTSDPARPPLEALLVHRDWVRAMARRLAGSGFDGDDLEQDAWLAAAKARPTDGAGIRAWFAKVVRNRRAETHRLGAHRGDRESRAARPEATRGGAALVVDAEAHGRVVQAVLSLDEPWRETVLLRFYEGLPPRDVALRMSVPVDTVRTRLRRAAELLRDALGGRREDWLGALAPLLLTKHGAPSSSLTATGVIAMQTTTKVAIAAAVLVAAGVAVWQLGGDDEPTRGETASSDPRPVSVPGAAGERASKPREGSRAERSSAATLVAETPSSRGSGTTVAAADRGRVVGRILLPDGAPAAGAAIGGTGLNGWIEADADGRFTANVRAFATPQPLWVIVPGCRPSGMGTFVVTAGADIAVADFRLSRDEVVTVRGRVVSRGGLDISAGEVRAAETYDAASLDATRWNPEPDAHLMLAAVPPGKSQPAALREFLDATRAPIGAGGAFELRLSASLGDVWLFAKAPGHAQGGAGIRRVRDWSGIEAEIALEPIRTIRGVVIDAVTRQPIAAYVGRGESADLTTDAAGRFEFTPVDGAKSWVTISAPKHWDEWAEAPPDGSSITVELQPHQPLAGRVRLADGTPVANAQVLYRGARGRHASLIHGAQTDAEGRFQYPNVCGPSGPVTISPLADSSVSFRAVEVKDVAAGRTDLEFVVDAALTIAGRVVDAEGQPVQGVRLHAWPADSVGCTSGDDGAFLVRGLAPGRVSIRASGADAGYLPQTVADVEAGARDLVVRVTKGLAISGVVVDEDGRPATGRVHCNLVSSSALSGEAYGVAELGPGGRFEVRGLERGRYRLMLVRKSAGESFPVMLAGGEDVETGAREIELRVLLGGSIAGVLLDPSGARVAKWPVTALWNPDDASGRQVQTDERGRFEIRGLPPNRVYTVKAKDVVVRDVALGTRDLVLRLP